MPRRKVERCMWCNETKADCLCQKVVLPPFFDANPMRVKAVQTAKQVGKVSDIARYNRKQMKAVQKKKKKHRWVCVLTCDKCNTDLAIIYDDGHFIQEIKCFNCYIATKPNVLMASNEIKNMTRI